MYGYSEESESYATSKCTESESCLDESEKVKSEEQEILHKKRGPKKRSVKRIINTTFRLEDSDIQIDYNENFDSICYDEANSYNNMLWVEKYRPKIVSDLVLTGNAMNIINSIVESRVMPNIIITGRPGIGKTSTVTCMARNLLGKYFHEGTLEMNASDDRNSKHVQDIIEYFCKKKLEIHGNYSKQKLVILDEADNMTTKAQQLIHNLMEQYYSSTRFIFTCNDSKYIIESIQSRCVILNYPKIDNADMALRLKKICDIESVPYSVEGLNTIVAISQGDLRKAINNLQLTFNGHKNVIPENVDKLCDKPSPIIIHNILIECRKKNVRTALRLLNELIDKGYSSSDISFDMFTALKDMDGRIISEQTKMKFLREICDTNFIINKGMNTPLQLNGMIMALCRK